MPNAFLVKPEPFTATSVDGSAAGTSPAYLADDRIGLVHRGLSTTVASIVVDLGATVPVVNFAAFLSTNVTGAQTLLVRGDDDADPTADEIYNSGGADPFMAGATLPVSRRSHSWWEHPTTEIARYWRFDVNTLGGTAFEAGRLVIGKKVQFARNYSFGMAPGVRDTGSIEWTPQGTMMRRFGKRVRTLEIEFEALTSGEVETSLLPLLEEVGNTAPLLIVTDPAADANRQNRMFFGFLESEHKVPRRAYDRWQWRGVLRSVI